MVSFPGGGGTICHGMCSLIMKFVWGGFTIEGEALAYGIVSPLDCTGEVLPWDLFRGYVCHMVFLKGQLLPYGILSGGGGGEFPCDTGVIGYNVPLARLSGGHLGLG